MCFAVLSDETAAIDLVIMPNLYRRIASKLKKGEVVQVKGKSDKEGSCLVNQLNFISKGENDES